MTLCSACNAQGQRTHFARTNLPLRSTCKAQEQERMHFAHVLYNIMRQFWILPVWCIWIRFNFLHYIHKNIFGCSNKFADQIQIYWYFVIYLNIYLGCSWPLLVCRTFYPHLIFGHEAKIFEQKKWFQKRIIQILESWANPRKVFDPKF